MEPLLGRLSLITLFAAVALALGGCSPDPSGSKPEHYARITAPKSGATLHGSVDVTFGWNVPGGTGQVAFGVDDEAPIPFKTPSGAFELRSTALDNGPHTLVLAVTATDGTVYRDRLDVVVDNPSHRLVSAAPDRPRYARGDLVTIDLEYTEAELSVEADFSAVDSNFDPDAVHVEDAGDGRFTVTYTISEDNIASEGMTHVTLVADNDAGRVIENQVPLNTTHLPLIPIEIEGGTLVERHRPRAAIVPAGEAPRLRRVTGPDKLLTGVPVDFDLAWEAPEGHAASRIIVTAEGHSGHYVIPVSGDEATLSIRLPSLAPGSDGSLLDLLFTVVDTAGQAIDWVAHEVTAIIVEHGGAQVTLAWDAPVDLDLRVVDPEGGTLGYASRSVGAGKLDLDSNAGCHIDGINAENAAWTPGEELPGRYDVFANLFDACGQERVNYEVTIQACGERKTLEGTLTASQASRSGGVLVDSFVVDCHQRVHGTVRYQMEDYVGGAVVHAAFAPVRVRRLSDGAVLAVGMTDRDGAYDLRFSADDGATVAVEAEASHHDPETDDVLIRVVGLDGDAAYVYRSGPIDTEYDSTRERDLVVPVADGAGAFHIVRNARAAFEWTEAKVHRTPGPLRARWGYQMPTPFGGSYYDGLGTMYIDGTFENPDEFDASIVAHEVMHHVVEELSRGGPGGVHKDRNAPAFAWNEGIASVLGQDVIGSPLFMESRPKGSPPWNLEHLDMGDPQIDWMYHGTSTGTQAGDVNEWLVASVVWDLLDPENEPHDRLSGMHGPVVESVFGYMAGTDFLDRGKAGDDFVDFLDGYRCASEAAALTDPTIWTDEALVPLLAERQFPYDFIANPPCP